MNVSPHFGAVRFDETQPTIRTNRSIIQSTEGIEPIVQSQKICYHGNRNIMGRHVSDFLLFQSEFHSDDTVEQVICCIVSSYHNSFDPAKCRHRTHPDHDSGEPQTIELDCSRKMATMCNLVLCELIFITPEPCVHQCPDLHRSEEYATLAIRVR